jgi:hypothetical protein
MMPNLEMTQPLESSTSRNIRNPAFILLIAAPLLVPSGEKMSRRRRRRSSTPSLVCLEICFTYEKLPLDVNLHTRTHTQVMSPTNHSSNMEDYLPIGMTVFKVSWSDFGVICGAFVASAPKTTFGHFFEHDVFVLSFNGPWLGLRIEHNNNNNNNNNTRRMTIK